MHIWVWAAECCVRTPLQQCRLHKQLSYGRHDVGLERPQPSTTEINVLCENENYHFWVISRGHWRIMCMTTKRSITLMSESMAVSEHAVWNHRLKVVCCSVTSYSSPTISEGVILLWTQILTDRRRTGISLVWWLTLDIIFLISRVKIDLHWKNKQTMAMTIGQHDLSDPGHRF